MRIWNVLLRIGRKRNHKYEIVQVYAGDAQEAGEVASRWRPGKFCVVSVREEVS